MKHSILLSLALTLAPVAALAQNAPPPPPDAAAPAMPDAQERAAMQQLHAQFDQARIQTRSRMLAALTPAHRNAVATIVGQLALAPNPDSRAAAQSLDAILSPGEKQSVLAIDTAQRTNMHALMEQHRAAMESTMSAQERAQMDQHVAQMKAFMQSHPRPEANDPGAIVLHTLGAFGGHGMIGHGL